MDIKKQAGDALASLKGRGMTALSVSQAIWKSGIPERFWIVLFFVGLLFGIAGKGLAHDHLTIGFDDYRLRESAALYDLNATQEKALSEGASLTEPDEVKTYPACTLND